MARVRWVVAAIGDDDAVLDRALRAARAGTAEGVEVVYLARSDAAGVAHAAVAEDAVRVVLACHPDAGSAPAADVEEHLGRLGVADVEVRTTP